MNRHVLNLILSVLCIRKKIQPLCSFEYYLDLKKFYAQEYWRMQLMRLQDCESGWSLPGFGSDTLEQKTGPDPTLKTTGSHSIYNGRIVANITHMRYYYFILILPKSGSRFNHNTLTRYGSATGKCFVLIILLFSIK